MQAGLTPVPECAERFNELRMKRAYRYIIYTVNEDGTNFVVERIGDREENFEQFKDNMPKDNPR